MDYILKSIFFDFLSFFKSLTTLFNIAHTIGVFPANIGIDYNTKLLNELKSDKDYGKIYECSLADNEVKCYIKEDLLVGFTIDSADITKYLTKYDDIIPNINGINRVLNKFGMTTKGELELGIFYNPVYRVYKDNIEYFNYVDGETYLSKYTYFETTMNCQNYRFYLTKINLLDLDNLNKYIDVIEDQPSEEISEDKLGHCGKKLCTWKVTVNKLKYVCDVASQTMNFSHTEEVDVLYRVCDANDENCKNVSKDEFQYYYPDAGYLFDLKICDGSEKSGDACRSFIDGKWDAIIFQN